MGKKKTPTSFLPRPPACLDHPEDTKKLEDEARAIQARLKELFTQLWDENATFQRIMYKNQNQHRRTLYFRRLTQVRRDLLLLHTMRLPEAADALPLCLSPSKPQKMSREELQRRLLGGARLLQLMADPVLAAGAAVEGLLSQSFFMPFALTVLAMLARLRALLVQGLYEVVSAFNLVAASLRKVEVASDAPLFLECSWDSVKLAFSEKAPPPQPLPELIPLPTCVSTLPDAGWFIDDRSAFGKEKLHVKSEPEPVIYEREEGFILEDSQFALLGEEEDDVAVEGMPTLGAVDVKEEMAMDVKKATAMDVVSTPILSKEVQGSLKERLSKEAKAELESWKAELDSWGVEGVEKSAEESHDSTKKRVAYVSVQIGGAKIPKIEHPV